MVSAIGAGGIVPSAMPCRCSRPVSEAFREVSSVMQRKSTRARCMTLPLCDEMLGRLYEEQTCSIARSLEVIGERWTLLVLRDAFLGVRRFEDYQRSLGIARNVLIARLGRLVDEGVLARVAYQQRPERFEYRLTEKGLGLWP